MKHFFGGIKRLENYGKSMTGTTRLTSTPLGLNKSRIYVGNLPPDIRTKDIEDLFYKYGKIAFIDLKNRRGPPFAFVEFEDPRDADDAVYARDGYDYDGYKLRVEFPRGGGGSFRGRSGGSSRSGGRGPPARRSQYRVVVTGMTSFQKLFHLESLVFLFQDYRPRVVGKT